VVGLQLYFVVPSAELLAGVLLSLRSGGNRDHRFPRTSRKDDCSLSDEERIVTRGGGGSTDALGEPSDFLDRKPGLESIVLGEDIQRRLGGRRYW